MLRSLPILSTSRSCSTRRILGCTDTGIWLISSMKRVPLSACSNLPFLPFFTAPVNEPSSYPNSSDSTRFSGNALEFIFIMRSLRLRLSACIACATSSFPVPVSPVIITVEFDFDAAIISSLSLRTAGDLPMMLLIEYFDSPKFIISFSASSSSLSRKLLYPLESS